MDENEKQEFLFYCNNLDEKTLIEVVKLLNNNYSKKSNILECDSEKQLQFNKGYLNCIIEVKRVLENFINVKNGNM